MNIEDIDIELENIKNIAQIIRDDLKKFRKVRSLDPIRECLEDLIADLKRTVKAVHDLYMDMEGQKVMMFFNCPACGHTEVIPKGPLPNECPNCGEEDIFFGMEKGEDDEPKGTPSYIS